MTMHSALYPRDDIDRVYVSRKGGRGLAGIEDSVNASIQELEDYIKKKKEILITVTSNSIENIRTNKTTKTRKQKREEKQLYGYFKWQTGEISLVKTWTWLRKGNLMRETKSFLIASQNNAVRNSYIKMKIDDTQQCWLCGDKDEPSNHMVSEWSKLFQKCIRVDTTWWERWSIWNCSRDWNLTILLNGICKNQSPSKRMRWRKFSRISSNKLITQ